MASGLPAQVQATDSATVAVSAAVAEQAWQSRGTHGERGRAAVNGRVSQVWPHSARSRSEARAGMIAAAEGTDLGDLFEYKLKDRVTIHKNESSLVPIVQTNVKRKSFALESLARFRTASSRAVAHEFQLAHPRWRQLHVLEDETFAGEGIIDPVKPGEKRLVSYAADLGVRVNKETHAEPQRVTKVRIIHGAMIQTSETRQDTIYTTRNEDSTPRTMLIEPPCAPAGVSRRHTNARRNHRRRLPLPPAPRRKSTFTLVVTESSAIESRFALTNIYDGQIPVFLQQKSSTPHSKPPSAKSSNRKIASPLSMPKSKQSTPSNKKSSMTSSASAKT